MNPFSRTIQQPAPLLFAITPPRATTPSDKVQAIADATLARLAPLSIDALVLYDIDDESERNPAARPFPFQRTLDPHVYRTEFLQGWQGPSVVYRCVGKYAPDELRGWLSSQPERVSTVFVGSPSPTTAVKTTLKGAMGLHGDHAPHVPLGGVAIPERHQRREDEHRRLLRKQAAGCSFFISQVVYDVSAAKDLASDYFYDCRDAGTTPAPLIFTLSLCGSTQTLDFLQWLGVNVPRWIHNELRRTSDPLDFSMAHCVSAAHELAQFCRTIGQPYGFNIESVSSRRTEIEATVELAKYVQEQPRRVAVSGPKPSSAATKERSVLTW